MSNKSETIIVNPPSGADHRREADSPQEHIGSTPRGPELARSLYETAKTHALRHSMTLLDACVAVDRMYDAYELAQMCKGVPATIRHFNDLYELGTFDKSAAA